MPALQHDERPNPIEGEPLVVWQWRFEQARRLGVPLQAAAMFADDRELELGRLRELVDAGCAPELAVRIV